jgi:hypothetical protein
VHEPEIVPQVVQKALSVRSVGSRNSAKSAASLKKKKAEIHLQGLLEDLRLQEEEAELAKKLRNIQKEREIARARCEMKAACAEEEAAEDEESEMFSVQSEVVGLDAGSSPPELLSHQAAFARPPPLVVTSSQTATKSEQENAPRIVDSSASGDLVRSLTDAIRVQGYLPKPEIPTFDGQPARYQRFIASFKTAVEDAVEDDRVKLNYLIQHTSGEPQRAIEDCAVMDPAKGYRHAKEILQRRYGQPWIIAEDYLRRLMTGPQVKANDGAGLSRLSLEISKCAMNLKELGFRSEVDNCDTLRRIVKRLPYNLRVKWAEVSYKLTAKGKLPRFDDLTKFIEERENVALSMFGRDLESKDTSGADRDNRNRRNPSRPTADHEATFMTGGSQLARSLGHEENQGSSPRCAGSAAAPSSCFGCQGSCRDLADCPMYNAANIDDRRKVLWARGACFNCLKPGHRAKQCPQPTQCEVTECSGKHHRTMHIWKTEEESDAGAADQEGGIDCMVSSTTCPQVLLGIVPVKVRANGKMVETNALLDNGSSQSFCSEALLRQLGIQGRKLEYSLSTLTQEDAPATAEEVTLDIQGMAPGATAVMLERVWSVPHLAVSMERAVRPESLSQFSHLAHIPVAQPVGSKVDLLIGATSTAIIPLEVCLPPSAGLPYAELTSLGWVIRGPTSNKSGKCKKIDVNWIDADPLDNALERMWKTEFADHLSSTKRFPFHRR